ncbi:hypothetical protein ACOMHN_022195 [Nucella lapillus]
MSNDVVASRIKQIVERYDVLLIQEIRDKSVESVNDLLSLLQLTDRVVLHRTYQYEDPSDDFEREPYVVKIAPLNDNTHNISLIALHAKPSDATSEIGHLPDVISSTLQHMGSDSEPVVLGDLNADCSYSDLEDRQEANDPLTVDKATYSWLIGEDADTTTRSSTDCAYDRIVVTSTLQNHVTTMSATVFDFGQWLGITETETLAVSDHYPVEMTIRF